MDSASQADLDFSKRGFVLTFVLPAMVILIVPVIGLAFSTYAQEVFDAQLRALAIEQLNADANLSPEDRATAIAFYETVPFSEAVLDEHFAAQLEWRLILDLATLRWMIRLSILSILSAIAVFLMGVICVWLSIRSPYAQYVSLLAGWHILRLHAAAQTIIIGLLLTGMSYWIPALLFHRLALQLTMLVGIVALLGMGKILLSIFTSPKLEFSVEGAILSREAARPVWEQLQRLCKQVGTTEPDQIIAGIDDQLFVTEYPLIVNERRFVGRSLFVSLPLLKQLRPAEADALLTHELAHFIGHDAYYTRQIAPLLLRYQAYLAGFNKAGFGLENSGFAGLVYHYLVCFRALYELAMREHRVEREYQADQIAAEVTSAWDCASAMLRSAAYSNFRRTVENDLFQQQRPLQAIGVGKQLELGFPAYLAKLADEAQLEQFSTVHPFDTHPSIAQRFNALGMELEPTEIHQLLATPSAGGSLAAVEMAEKLEQQQWQAYEEQFRMVHQQSLPYRYLPANDEELAIVRQAFPDLTFDSKSGTLTIDYDKVFLSTWPAPIRYTDILHCAVDSAGVLTIHLIGVQPCSRTLNTGQFQQGELVLSEFQLYFGRYLAAVESQRQHISAAPT